MSLSQPPFFIEISQRKHGSMRLENSENRIRFLESLNISPESVVSAQLVHGNHVEIINDNEHSIIPNSDGLITDNPEIYLSITVADCLPIALFHKKQHITALLHAGWRGLHSRIIDTALEKILRNWNVFPAEICAHIGPGISACHYEVQPDVAQLFSEYPQAIFTDINKKVSLDLKKIALLQLQNQGILLKNIADDQICTACQSEKYFSHRVDQTKPVNTMLVLAGWYNS